MLARVFSHLANSGNPYIVHWLQQDAIEGATIIRVQMFQNVVVFETNDKKEITWTSGMLYKKLKQGRPKKIIPLLMELCKIYDTGIHLDKFLTCYLSSMMDIRLPFSLFYLEDGKITTILSTKKLGKTALKGCKVISRNKKETTLSLNSTKRLRSALLEIIERDTL